MFPVKTNKKGGFKILKKNLKGDFFEKQESEDRYQICLKTEVGQKNESIFKNTPFLTKKSRVILISCFRDLASETVYTDTTLTQP